MQLPPIGVVFFRADFADNFSVCDLFAMFRGNVMVVNNMEGFSAFYLLLGVIWTGTYAFVEAPCSLVYDLLHTAWYLGCLSSWWYSRYWPEPWSRTTAAIFVSVCWPKAAIANIVLLTLERMHWEMACVRGEVVVWEWMRWATGVFVMGRHGVAWDIDLETDGGVVFGVVGDPPWS